MAFLTMYFAGRADLNTGVIITIWSINPLFIAVCDYLLFNQELRYYHEIGLVSIVICIVLLSLTGVVNPVVPGQ